MDKKSKRRSEALNAPMTGMVEIFCRYIIRNGKKIYPKKGKLFHFFMKPKET